MMITAPKTVNSIRTIPFKGMDSKVVQKLMGHSNISITLNIYTHVMESKMDSDMENLSGYGTGQIYEMPAKCWN